MTAATDIGAADPSTAPDRRHRCPAHAVGPPTATTAPAVMCRADVVMTAGGVVTVRGRGDGARAW
ncbi:hypothetical protein ABZ567_29540 [Streptomyces sp. NPDC016459]|uniref:hypothetical protein n=1 Tax=Streptomyces sp. NPDC016459 TaxID=3157190 RepID=UPI00340E9128